MRKLPRATQCSDEIMLTRLHVPGRIPKREVVRIIGYEYSALDEDRGLSLLFAYLSALWLGPCLVVAGM